MEAARGDGGAFDHTSDGDVNVPSGIFFKGSTSEAIARAQQDDLVLIVFVAGRVWRLWVCCELSVSMRGMEEWEF